jgi:hypothetical protein
MKITIDHSKVKDVTTPSTTYANFPVYIKATGLSNVKANGAGIRFTDSSGNQLPREIEYYSGGTLNAWVKFTLTKDSSDASNDEIYMYYGNSGASEPAAGSDYGSQKVWDTNYKMVQHLEETTGGANAIKDSTSNANHGTDSGSPNLDATGQIDGADDFDGTDDYVDCGNDVSLNITDAITIEAWIYIKDYGDSYPRIVSKEATVSAESFALLLWKISHKLQFLIDTGSESPITSTGAIPKDQWVHVAVTFSRPNGIIYINGNYDNSGVVDKSVPITTNHLTIGSNNQNNRNFNCTIDEVRISATARSGDWIKTSYNNQNDPGTFLTFGSEQPKGIDCVVINEVMYKPSDGNEEWVELYNSGTASENIDGWQITDEDGTTGNNEYVILDIRVLDRVKQMLYISTLVMIPMYLTMQGINAPYILATLTIVTQ